MLLPYHGIFDLKACSKIRACVVQPTLSNRAGIRCVMQVFLQVRSALECTGRLCDLLVLVNRTLSQKSVTAWSWLVNAVLRDKLSKVGRGVGLEKPAPALAP